MRPEQFIVATLSALLLALTLAGLIVRDRARLCWSFTGLLAAYLAGNLLTSYTPLFYSWTFWTLKHVLYAALQFAVALELAAMLFVSLPRARVRAIAIVAAGVMLVAATVAATAADMYWVSSMVYLQGVMWSGAAWLILAVIASAAWYHVPLHPFHVSMLRGLGFYVVVFTLGIELVRARRAEGFGFLDSVDPILFAATVGSWAWAAWRPEQRQASSSAVVRFLQPWAVR